MGSSGRIRRNLYKLREHSCARLPFCNVIVTFVSHDVVMKIEFYMMRPPRFNAPKYLGTSNPLLTSRRRLSLSEEPGRRTALCLLDELLEPGSTHRRTSL